jgi:hypothetical protein
VSPCPSQAGSWGGRHQIIASPLLGPVRGNEHLPPAGCIDAAKRKLVETPSITGVSKYHVEMTALIRNVRSWPGWVRVPVR